MGVASHTFDFALTCNLYGSIINISKNFDGLYFFKEGCNLSQYVDSGSQTKYFDFLKDIQEYGTILGCEMNILCEGNVIPINFSAAFLENNILILGLYNDGETAKLYEEIIIMNNSQINCLRALIKDKALYEEKQEQFLYDEISKLNNELINSKRLIEKQNLKLKEYNEKLAEMALKDQLTGAYNRYYFHEKINEEVAKARRFNYKLTLLLIDFNDFKQANDCFGHHYGDSLLKKLVELSKKHLRKDFDFLFRLGGDEFVILLPDCDAENALLVAERLNKSFQEFTDASSLSYGTAEITPQEINEMFDIDSYYKIADQRMYEFKNRYKSERRILAGFGFTPII